MKLFSSIRSGTAVKNAMKTITGMIQVGESFDDLERPVVTLLGAVMKAGGKGDGWDVERLKDLLPRDIPPSKASTLLHEFEKRDNWDVDSVLGGLSSRFSAEKKVELMSSLTRIALYNGEFSDEERKLINHIAAGIGVPEAEIDDLIHNEIIAQENRERAMRSWTGIIVALIIITIFILTATFLKAVLFGFILAFMLLPLERFYERKFRQPGPVVKLLSVLGSIFSPLGKYSERITKRFIGGRQRSKEEEEKAILSRRVNKAVAATVFTFIIGMIVLVTAVSSISFNYISAMGHDIKQWADKQVEKQRDIQKKEQEKQSQTQEKTETETVVPAPLSKEESYFSSFLGSVIRKLEDARSSIEKWPMVQYGIEELSKVLKDENNRRQMFSALAKKTGGIFSFTAGFMSTFATILFDLLMTMFFALLFLQKMALYSARNDKENGITEYVVKSIFHSKWMPHTSEETRSQARKILDDIGLMMKTWLKGYLSIIAIESTIYITAFMLYGVPYAPILGFLAGCTILLPYVGPISSAGLTLLVCLAMGGAHTNILTLLAVILTYIVVTGILDQLFIYPALVGEALGLTNVETIIVVLVGALFAGIPGMIFAVPTASVIKYLIPLIYRCWEPHEKAPAEIPVTE